MTGYTGMARMLAAVAIVAAAGGAPLTSAHAQNVLQEWDSIKAPPPPALKEVTVDPKKTAVISMDFNGQNCTAEKRKRCFAVLPNVEKVLADARKHGMLVAHTLTSHMKPEDIATAVGPKPGEMVVHGSGDKFSGNDLEKTLKDKGITTVILMGTEANSAVLYTALGAAIRRFKAIVPVDTMPAETAYQEQFTAWQIVNGSQLREHATLTRVDMIKY